MNHRGGPAFPIALTDLPGQITAQVADGLAGWLLPAGRSAAVEQWSQKEWQIAAWLAYWQGAVPWLLGRSDEDGIAIDAGLRGRLDRVRHLMRSRTERILAEAAEVMGALISRGIQVMPLKGLVIASRYFEDPLDRPMRDMDLLIHESDREAATLAVSSLGYSLLETQEKATMWVRGDRLAETWSPDHLRPIDLHEVSVTDLSRLDLGVDAALWDRSSVAPFLGVSGAQVPASSALYFHTAFHASYNCLTQNSRLSHLQDLETIGRTFDSSEWDEFVGLSSGRTARMVFPAIAFLDRYAPASIPPGVLDVLKSQTPSALRSWVHRRGFGSLARTSQVPEEGWSMLSTLNVRWRLIRGWREWFNLFFPPRRVLLRSHRWANTRLWPLAYTQRRLGSLLFVLRRLAREATRLMKGHR